MAIEGKKKYAIYLNETEYEYVKSFIEATRFKGGMSGFFDTHLIAASKTLRAGNYIRGKKLTLRQLIKLGIKGLKQEIV